jgi:hypothetical protein
MATLAQDLLDAQSQIETLKASLATVNGERDALKVTVDELSAKLTAEQTGRAADAEGHKAALDAETAAHTATKNALAEATQKLADPAYQMAGTTGSQTPVPEGGQPADAPPANKAQLEAEYRKIDGSTIEGARARAEFREKYKVELGL